MTLDQIIQEANDRYKLGKGACARERREIRKLKERYIQKKMIEFGLTEEGNKVNS